MRNITLCACVPSSKEVADDCRDFLGMSLEREVARVEEMDFRTGNVAFERLGTCWQEKRIVLAPHRKVDYYDKLISRRGPLKAFFEEWIEC